MGGDMEGDMEGDMGGTIGIPRGRRDRSRAFFTDSQFFEYFINPGRFYT